MNEKPPLPPPSGVTCPNCGAGQDAGVAYCSNCGAPLQAATSGGPSQTFKTLATLGLGCGVLFFGSLGGCLALLGAFSGNLSAEWPALAFGVAALLLAAACVWGIMRVQRKK